MIDLHVEVVGLLDGRPCPLEPLKRTCVRRPRHERANELKSIGIWQEFRGLRPYVSDEGHPSIVRRGRLKKRFNSFANFL